MSDMKTTLGIVRAYIKEFTDSVINSQIDVGYLPMDAINFSVDEVSNENGNIIDWDIEGNSKREFLFSLAITFEYEEQITLDIENSNFFEAFQQWIEDNNNKGIYPLLNKGLEPTDIKVLSTRELIISSELDDKAKYEIKCQLIYEKEAI